MHFPEYFFAFCGKHIALNYKLIPYNVFFFIYFHRFIIPESPRWLLCKGRIAEVKAIIKKACEFNGREVPANIDKLLKPPVQEEQDEGCISLFGSKYLRLITICFVCIWFTMNVVYYGLVLNMSQFGDVYLNSVSTI